MKYAGVKGGVVDGICDSRVERAGAYAVERVRLTISVVLLMSNVITINSKC